MCKELQEDSAKCKLLHKKLQEDEHIKGNKESERGKSSIKLKEGMAKEKLRLLRKDLQEDTVKFKLLHKKLQEDEHGKGNIEVQEGMAKGKLLLLARASTSKLCRSKHGKDNIELQEDMTKGKLLRKELQTREHSKSNT